MRVTKMQVKLGVTVNTGNYENLRLDVMLEGEFQDAEDEISARAELWDQAECELAYALIDHAQRDLHEMEVWHFVEEVREGHAAYRSSAFRWLKQFHEEVATHLLASTVEEFKLKESGEEADAPSLPDVPF